MTAPDDDHLMFACSCKRHQGRNGQSSPSSVVHPHQPGISDKQQWLSRNGWFVFLNSILFTPTSNCVSQVRVAKWLVGVLACWCQHKKHEAEHQVDTCFDTAWTSKQNIALGFLFAWRMTVFGDPNFPLCESTGVIFRHILGVPQVHRGCV